MYTNAKFGQAHAIVAGAAQGKSVRACQEALNLKTKLGAKNVYFLSDEHSHLQFASKLMYAISGETQVKSGESSKAQLKSFLKDYEYVHFAPLDLTTHHKGSLKGALMDYFFQNQIKLDGAVIVLDGLLYHPDLTHSQCTVKDFHRELSLVLSHIAKESNSIFLTTLNAARRATEEKHWFDADKILDRLKSGGYSSITAVSKGDGFPFEYHSKTFMLM